MLSVTYIVQGQMTAHLYRTRDKGVKKIRDDFWAGKHDIRTHLTTNCWDSQQLEQTCPVDYSKLQKDCFAVHIYQNDESSFT